MVKVKDASKNSSFFSRKISLLWTMIIAVLSVAICWMVMMSRPAKMKVVTEQVPLAYTSSVHRVRLNTYELIHPVLFSDNDIEDSRLLNLKEKIEEFIETRKEAHTLASASVYLRKMDDGGWFGINKNETYTPASLQKVGIMMAYLKDMEANPGLVNKMIYFDKHFSTLPTQNIKVFSMQENRSYSVNDLLHYMIAYSDNDALNLLYGAMNRNTYRRLFTDMQMEVPNLERDDYTINVKDFARFFRILYNSTYLTHDLSEYGLRLLTECNFKGGFTKNLDPNILVAHKFGERVYGDAKELHEVGIVYAEGQPYLLGVMTKGYDLSQLSDVISGISDMVYAAMSTAATVTGK